MSRSICLLFITLFAFLSQVVCDGEPLHAIEKRHVSVLARQGDLPYYPPGKRYVAAMAKNGELTSFLRPAWNKKYQDSDESSDMDDEEEMEKRYVGALARGGGFRIEEKRGFGVERSPTVEGLVKGLATGEELKRLRLEALKEELYRERQEEAQSYVDPDKRDYSFDQDDDDDDDEEESVDKRGGISSLFKSGYPMPKRTMDDELERLMAEVYGVEDKRSVASLARGLNFPLAYQSGKRNLPSLMRDRAWPLGEGKRHIGSFVRTYGYPSSEKRNMASLAKNRDFPYAYMPGKREAISSSESEEDDMSKRYVAALLRQGRLPVGEDAAHSDSDESQDSEVGQDSKEDQGERKKKSVPPVAAATRSKRSALDMYAFGLIPDKGSDNWASPINKKYFEARGGGKIPGGRMTASLGRRGGRQRNSGRRSKGHWD